MSEWKEYKLDEVCELIVDCVNRTAPTVDYPTPYKMIRTTNVKNGKIDVHDVRYVTEATYKTWVRRGKPEIGDIVLTREAPVGEIGLIRTNDTLFLGQRTMMYRPNSKIADSDFLYYSFLTASLKEQILGAAMGSVVEHIRVPDAKDFKVQLPELSEQISISSILRSLDDKLELLHSQNKTLEAMAETLFRQWFVEEAEESWEEMSLYDAIDLIGGGTPKTSEPEFWDGDIGWLSGGDISGNHKNFVTKAEKSITEFGLKNSSTRLLPKFSTVISARGTVGKYCILAEPMTFSQSNYGIKPKYDNCFFFTYLLIAYSVEELQSAAYGSVFDTITTNTFKEHKVSLPISDKIEEFELQVKPYFLKMLNNQIQIQSLIQVRDTLLPKLMSGEIQIN